MLPLAALTGTMFIRRAPRLFRPLLVPVARRQMTTGPAIDKLSSKGTQDPLHKGVEGPHISACCYHTGMYSTHNDAGDLLPSPTPPTQHIKGDWVLFHPVYTPDELKAVKVSGKWRL